MGRPAETVTQCLAEPLGWKGCHSDGDGLGPVEITQHGEEVACSLGKVTCRTEVPIKRGRGQAWRPEIQVGLALSGSIRIEPERELRRIVAEQEAW